jgi:hypothetical protein
LIAVLLTASLTSAQEESEAAVSAECERFAQDRNADLGEVIRAGCKPTLAQMSALMDNPLGNVAMLFTQYDLYNMKNPENRKEGNYGVYTGIAQFPKRLSKDWNLINRVVWTVGSQPLDQDKIDNALGGLSNFDFGSIPEGILPPEGSPIAPIDLFDGRTTDFGDMYYVGLFAPSQGIDWLNGKILWGAGFDLGFPTAGEDILGTGKWTAGPAALAVYMGPKWKIGGLLQQYWDIGGDGDRSDVSLTNLQYFVYYSLSDTTSIGAAPNIICNWRQEHDNQCTVPVGIGINRTFQFGKVPVRLGVEFHYSAIEPDDVVGSKWNVRFFVIPAAPSALFGWMN